MRAFDESALYGDDTRSAQLPKSQSKQVSSEVAFAALRAPRSFTRTSVVGRRGRARNERPVGAGVEVGASDSPSVAA